MKGANKEKKFERKMKMHAEILDVKEYKDKVANKILKRKETKTIKETNQEYTIKSIP